MKTGYTGLRIWCKSQHDKYLEEAESFMSFKERFSDKIEKMNEVTF